MKTLKNGSQKLLIISPNLFPQSSPDHSPQPRIDISYYKHVPRLIRLLICALQSLIEEAWRKGYDVQGSEQLGGKLGQ